MLQKIKDALKSALEFIRGLYNRESVNKAREEAKALALSIYGWVRDQVKANPQAAFCGGLVASVGFIAWSAISFGLVVTVLFTAIFAVAGHYYFVSSPESTETASN